MTKVSVRRLARFVSRHPNWCLLATFLLTVLSLWKMQELKIEMDMTSLLPTDSEVSRITNSALRDFGSFDFMLVVVESKDPENRAALKKAAEELQFALNDRNYIRNVTYKLTPESFELGTPGGDARAVSLLTTEDWDSLEKKLSRESIEESMQRLQGLLNALPPSKQKAVLQDPFNFNQIFVERVKIKSGPLKVNLVDNYFMSRDGKMLLMLVLPVKPATDLQFAQDFKKFLDATKEGIYKRNPEFGSYDDPDSQEISISYFGAHYETIADSQLVKQDFYRTSIASFVAVCLLFFFAFRRPEALLFVGIPLIIGVIWTLGLTSLFIGRLTQVTMAFSAILIGLGIDFSVHLYNRYLEEIRLGRKNRDALRAAVVETGPGIIAGAATTAIAFFGMTITSFVGFNELGRVTGMGVLCCLLSVILVLPPLLAHFGSGPVGVFTQRPMSTFGLRRIHYTVTAYPRVTVLVGLIVAGYLGLHAINVQFEDDFRYLKQPSNDYIALRDRMLSHFEVPSNQVLVIVTGDSEQEALEENDRLFNNIYAAQSSGLYPLIAIDSLRYFVPSQATQRTQLERMANQNLDQLRLNINEAAVKYKISPRAFDPFMARLDQFRTSAREALQKEKMPIDLLSLDRKQHRALADLMTHYIYKTRSGKWRIATQIYPPPTDEWLSSVPEVFIDNLQLGLKNEIEFTGSAVIQQEMRKLILKDLALTVLVVLLAVIIYLMIYFESAFKAVLATIPVVVALMCMLGVLELFNMKLHYLNIIALPMIIGIGVDSGIHLMQRFYEQDRRNLLQTVTRTGRAVVITSMTTIFGFGSLALADFRGIRDLGILAIIGVGCTLIASVLILPAILRLTDPKAMKQGGMGDDLG